MKEKRNNTKAALQHTIAYKIKSWGRRRNEEIKREMVSIGK